MAEGPNLIYPVAYDMEVVHKLRKPHARSLLLLYHIRREQIACHYV